MAPSGDGPLWRGACNAYVWDGILRRRDGLVDSDETMEPGSPVPVTEFYSASSTKKHQTPMLIADIDCCDRPTRVLVTSRELFTYRQATGWTNLTPIYNAGTVSSTSTTEITGSGTSWAARGIFAEQAIELPAGSGEWYTIQNITGENITLGQPINPARYPLSGDDYNIRRTFASIDNENLVEFVFGQFFNGDYYICGPFGPNLDAVVLRITGLTDQTDLSHTDVEYVFGGEYVYAVSTDETPSIDASLDYIDAHFVARGMQIVQDGRVVLAGVEGTPPSPTAKSRIRYSSHLNPGVWNDPPGGFTDLVTREGPCTGLGKIGTTLTVHHSDGIVLGSYTGNNFFPFSWEDSRSEYGTISPGSLVAIHGMEIFASHDFNLRVFRGTTAEVFDPSFRFFLKEQELTVDTLARSVAIFHESKDEYRLYSPTMFAEGTSNGQTKAYITNGQFGWPLVFDCPITAALHQTLFDMNRDVVIESAQDVRLASISAGASHIVGSPLVDSSGNVVPCLRVLREVECDEDIPVYVSSPSVGSDGDFFVASDDIDLQIPERRKYVDTVHVVYEPSTHLDASYDTSLSVSIQYDGGSWEEKTIVLTKNVGGVAHFHFTPKSGHKFVVKLSTDTTDCMGHALISLAMVVSVVGEEAAS